MCGIAMLLGKRRSAASPAIQRMADWMQHRGPDDSGIELIPLHDGPDPVVVAFGFRRLSIQDLTPAGHQPMVHPYLGGARRVLSDQPNRDGLEGTLKRSTTAGGTGGRYDEANRRIHAH